MSKITLDSIASGYDLSKINNNFQTIATAFENTLSRDGTTPNTMGANLDMNGKRIINQLAESGDGFIWESVWVTATSYAVNNLVSENGNTYICTVAHTSGTFATDLLAGKWEVFAAKGASGAGSGDMLAANNLSDVASIATARTNLGLVIGTNVQAYDADLTTWAGVTPGTGVATALAVNVGTAGSPVVNGGVLGTPSSGNLANCTGYPGIFSVSYDSGIQTITAAGTLTLAHSLGTTPLIIQCLLKCNDAGGELGYTNGQYVIIGTAGNSYNGAGSTNTGVSVVVDSTNIVIRFGEAAATFILNNASTGVLQAITNSKWKFVIRAYA